MINESLEKLKEIYRHDFAHVTPDMPSNIAIPLIALRGLGEMVVVLAEMINERQHDLDNLINQANERVKNLKYPQPHGERCDTYLI